MIKRFQQILLDPHFHAIFRFELCWRRFVSSAVPTDFHFLTGLQRRIEVSWLHLFVWIHLLFLFGLSHGEGSSYAWHQGCIGSFSAISCCMHLPNCAVTNSLGFWIKFCARKTLQCFNWRTPREPQKEKAGIQASTGPLASAGELIIEDC